MNHVSTALNKHTIDIFCRLEFPDPYFLNKDPDPGQPNQCGAESTTRHVTSYSPFNTPAGLEEGDLPLILEVLLVADEEDEYGGAGQGARVRQPVGQAVEGLP